MTRASLDAIKDDVYVLGCAVADVERDLTGKPTLREYQDAVRWLLDAARPLLLAGPLSETLD
jgi:hypothetical protein